MFILTTFGRSDAQKVHAVVARSTFGSKHAEDTTCSVFFWALKRRFVWPARGIAHLPKCEQNVGVLLLSSSFKSVGRRGAFQEDLRRCISRGKRSTRDMMLGGQGADFIWVHQICRFAKMILLDRHGTSYDLASLFRRRCKTLDFRQMEWKNRKRHWHEAASFARNFHF